MTDADKLVDVMCNAVSFHDLVSVEQECEQIIAALAAAEREGFVMVPKVATDKMINAGAEENLNWGRARDSANQTWKAMLAARPKIGG